MPFYLATVIDAYSREIVGYSIGLRHNAEFVLEAVRDSIRKTGKKPEILHSDQGSEYRSFLADAKIRPSMSAKASPWQNGQQESYYGKFKLETRNLSDFATFEEAIEAVHHRVFYYNRKRMHTALKMPPAMFRERYFLLEKEKLRTDAGALSGVES